MTQQNKFTEPIFDTWCKAYYPLLTLARLVGVSIVKGENGHFVKDMVTQFYANCLLLFTVYDFFYNIIWCFICHHLSRNLSAFNQGFAAITQSLLVGFNLVATLYRNDTRLTNRLIECDEHLRDSGIQFNYSQARKSILKVETILIVITSFVIGFDFYVMWNETKKQVNLWFWICCEIRIVLFLFTSATINLYNHQLGIRFRLINRELIKMAHGVNNSVIFVRKHATGKDIAERLRLIKAAHKILTDTVNRSDEKQSFSSLLQVTSSISGNIIRGYAFIDNIVNWNDDPNRIINWTSLIRNWYWWVIRQVDLILSCYICDFTSQQANAIGEYIHMLIATNTVKDVEQELDLISRRVLHKETQYTIGGIVPKNLRALYGMYGTNTAYTVVLVQLKLSGLDAMPQENIYAF